MSEYRISILGAVGIPAGYGGFETLAQNLVECHSSAAERFDLVVYCSAKAFPFKRTTFLRARLRYINCNANGPQSIIYDVLSLLDATRRGDTHILMLGVSGTLAIPIVRLVSRIQILTNIDGMEWKREKWSWPARVFLRASEWAAVRFSHKVIADNQAIAEYVSQAYGRPCEVISYGGDHALAADPDSSATSELPDRYALALCRIEPENNVAMILDAFAELDTLLVFVGNWEKSSYGRELKARYAGMSNIIIHDPVYEPGALRAIRERATVYVHGHSAGGTNPSLVEMMHFGIPVLAHGCTFNRYTTEDKALYFETSVQLAEEMCALDAEKATRVGADMFEIAQRRYTWEKVGKAYFDLLDA